MVSPGGRGAQPIWIHGPARDAALALLWVPFALVAHTVEGDPRALRLLVASVMFLSFAHQPLTIPFVYASPWRLDTHRRLFLWSPIAALAIVAVFSRADMILVVVIGALWNAEHTLMQRYGLTRVYGRRAGDDQGRVERLMLIAWFLIPLLAVTARAELDRIASKFGSGTVSAKAATLFGHLSVEAQWLLPVAACAAAYLTARWLRHERTYNPGKWMYLASTAALFAVAVVDPLAGLVGFVGSHAIEYFVVVNRSVVSEATHPGALGRVSRFPKGPALFLATYLAAAVGLFVLLYDLAPTRVLLVGVLTIGALHFFYDSFIWKLRKPAVAASIAGVRAAGGG
jgi:hypothetical protein